MELDRREKREKQVSTYPNLHHSVCWWNLVRTNGKKTWLPVAVNLLSALGQLISVGDGAADDPNAETTGSPQSLADGQNLEV